MWKLEGITYWNDAVADVLNEMYDITLEILQKKEITDLQFHFF